jgi:hypothetical protein
MVDSVKFSQFQSSVQSGDPASKTLESINFGLSRLPKRVIFNYVFFASFNWNHESQFGFAATNFEVEIFKFVPGTNARLNNATWFFKKHQMGDPYV